VLRPQFSPALKWGILSAMIALAVALGYTNGVEWYGRLFSGSHRARFVVGFTMTTTVVGAAELFGFGLIWRGFLAGKSVLTADDTQSIRRRRLG
jgi:hypothetical protein